MDVTDSKEFYKRHFCNDIFIIDIMNPIAVYKKKHNCSSYYENSAL